MTALLWMRRDLRLHDHPALRAALDEHDVVVPVFCIDPRLLGGRHSSGPRTQFLLECLTDLREALRRRGSDLVLTTGRPERALPKLAREVEAQVAFWTDDVTPFAMTRDAGMREQFERAGIEVRTLPGLFAVDDPSSLLSSANAPYRVFTPFHRAWRRCERRQVLPAPRSMPALPSCIRPPKLPTLADLGLQECVFDPARGGEEAGRRAMSRFVTDHLAHYEEAREQPGTRGSSRLSPYLHFGCVSPRELEDQAGSGQAAETFRRQLCWRDFYAHVLRHFPDNARHEFQPRYRGKLRWSRAKKPFAAWCDGQTGYPFVDAGMRQLRREGWMHNRARLVVGSFLTKDLGIDWRWGERWFMRMLLDGDEANNNGNWQWIASVGVDPQPAFRRVYNPARQQARFDPDGSYVRRYVAELREVPDEYLAEPWTMPREVQTRVGCVIGRDYPRPIVDHGVARQEALARYAAASGS